MRTSRVMSTLLALVIGLLLMGISAQAQTTWYVDDDAVNDPGPGDPTVSDPNEDGSADHPFDAIQEGIDAAAVGDAVLVLDGTYTGDGNYGLDYAGKAITVQSENGPTTCIIDCQGSDADRRRGIKFITGETGAAVVDGFTVCNGYVIKGAAIRCSSSSPTIRDCIFRDNTAINYGGAIVCENGANPTVVNCIFYNNSANYGGGLRCYTSSLTMTSCTLSGNSASLNGGGLEVTNASNATLVNCILSDNQATYGPEINIASSSVPSTVTLAYSDVHGGMAVVDVDDGCTLNWGAGNIDTDPLFVDAGTGDYHLTSGSPCINGGSNYTAGLLSTDIEGAARIQQCRADLGAYESAYAPGAFEDCNTNSVDDDCDIYDGTSDDYDQNHVPDECEDCNGNGVADACDVDCEIGNCASDPLGCGGASDCNGNGVPDECDIDDGTSEDCNDNGIPDECIWLEEDCNGNGVPDECDIDDGTSEDCNGNGVPDECDIDDGTSLDCNGNGIPDECIWLENDCNGNTIPDECDIDDGTSLDCNGNGIPDECDLDAGTSDDYDLNGVPDECDPDCNGNGVPDACDVDCDTGDCVNHPLGCGTSTDNELEGVPDECVVHVPAEYATIQAAIDAVAEDQTVLVADGLYRGEGNRDLDFGGKNIIVRSANGPGSCIIDCEHAGRGFYLHNGEANAAVIQGFTITNGFCGGDGGAGILCDASSPTITNCIISSNMLDEDASHAAGITCLNGSNVTITDCVVTANSKANDPDEGRYEGHGVKCVDGDLTISGCLVSENGGYGVRLFGGTLSMSDCTIEGNGEYGVCGYNATMAIRASTIRDNGVDVSAQGFGVFCINCAGTISNCIIADNSDEGMRLRTSSLNITNCTVTGNTADELRGGGLRVFGDCAPTVANCIFWGNSALEDKQIGLFTYNGQACTVSVSYSDVQGGEDGVYVSDTCTLDWGSGSIDADPLLAFADYQRILSGSPCIDAGTNTPPGGLALTDRDGISRSLDGDGDLVAVADMGAFEFVLDSPVIGLAPGEMLFTALGVDPYEDLTLQIRNCGGATLEWVINEQCPWLTVDPASGQSDGEIDDVLVSVDTEGLTGGTYVAELLVSDLDAANSPRVVTVTLHIGTTLRVPSEYTTIQAALNAAADGDTIVVADGTYSGPGNQDLNFHGKGVTLRSESGASSCTIRCVGSMLNDRRGVLFSSGEDENTVLDGFTITNGYVNWDGGGVKCSSGCSPTIANCVILDNGAEKAGGGIASYGSPSIINCVITENWVGGLHGECWGGGVSCRDGNAKLIGCLITGNGVGSEYDVEGGGIFADAATLTNCTIAGNSAVCHTWRGGAAGGGASANDSTIINCTIAGNRVEMDGNDEGAGAGVYLKGQSTMIGCTITNHPAQEGLHATLANAGEMQITNTIIWGNGYAIWNGGATPVVSYSDIQGGWAGTGNIDADPFFVDPDGPDNDPETWEDNDYHLSFGSPCIDTGDPAYVATPDETDFDGQKRVWDGDGDDTAIIDMGSDEYGSFAYGDMNCDGLINGFDIDAFVLVVGGQLTEYYTSNPDCDHMLADVNGDGAVDGFDINPFVDLLSG